MNYNIALTALARTERMYDDSKHLIIKTDVKLIGITKYLGVANVIPSLIIKCFSPANNGKYGLSAKKNRYIRFRNELHKLKQTTVGVKPMLKPIYWVNNKFIKIYIHHLETINKRLREHFKTIAKDLNISFLEWVYTLSVEEIHEIVNEKSF